MNEFYYIDRPSVPATQQVLVNISGIQEQGIEMSLSDVGTWSAYAVEVKNENADIIGSLLFVPGVSYASLMTPDGDMDGAVVSTGVEVSDSDEVAVEEAKPNTPNTPHPNQIPFNYFGENFNADTDVAELLEKVEAKTDAGTVSDLELDLAQTLVEIQIRNNNQYEMLEGLTSGSTI